MCENMATTKRKQNSSDGIIADIATYTCPICLELFKNPVIISCGHNHVYCQECVLVYQTQTADAHCPQCRVPFNPYELRTDSDTEHAMKVIKVPCKWCQQIMTLNRMKSHVSKCKKKDISIPQFKPVAETSQMYSENLPNRSTFDCPICHEKNFDCNGLIKHCNENHQNESGSYVCPVCSSMPWGDPNYLSQDFLNHLNMRHNFEYDTYVDFNQDDEEMFRQALQASLQER